jgi:hypothetical protein
MGDRQIDVDIHRYYIFFAYIVCTDLPEDGLSTGQNM